MSGVTLTIDGKRVTGESRMTILQAAQKVGIEIPSLCNIPELKPHGACRICIVEVQGSRTLLGSCHTPVREGMVVYTNSPKVIATRKVLFELMLAGHTGDCVNDPNAENCKLHLMAAEHEVGPSRFAVRKPRYYPVEDNPYVRRDLAKCIMCRRCVEVCRDIAKQNILSIGNRGIQSKIIAGYDEALTNDVCKGCHVCIDNCPTGALSAPIEQIEERKSFKTVTQKKTPAGNQRTQLLPLLKKIHYNSPGLTKERMIEISEKLNIPLNEVYGTATFYSFLSLVENGRYTIRVCKCIPCELKGAGNIVESIVRITGVQPGQTDADGKFSLELVNCIGACDQAPAMLVNDNLHGHLTPEKVSEILATYQ